MNKYIKGILLVGASIAAAGAAHAQKADTTGWYVGGSIGSSTLKPKLQNDDYQIEGRQDTHDTGFKLVGGYQFNANWAVEAAYQNLGKWTYSEEPFAAQAKVTGLSLAGVGLLPLGNGFSLMGKLGVVRQGFDARAVDTSTGESASRKLNKVTPLIGVGGEYAISPALSVRAEYEFFGVPTLAQSENEKLKAHTGLISVGLRYRF